MIKSVWNHLTNNPRRWVIRATILIGFSASAWFAFARANVPKGPDGKDQLPTVALGQELIYRGELLVAAVFIALLVLTPLIQGVINGRLPTEITARGAKYDPEDVAAGLKD